ncbi:MAG: hypothetical protein RKU31_01860 [Deltaproteobacteria bacterium]
MLAGYRIASLAARNLLTEVGLAPLTANVKRRVEVVAVLINWITRGASAITVPIPVETGLPTLELSEAPATLFVPTLEARIRIVAIDRPALGANAIEVEVIVATVNRLQALANLSRTCREIDPSAVAVPERHAPEHVVSAAGPARVAHQCNRLTSSNNIPGGHND